MAVISAKRSTSKARRPGATISSPQPRKAVNKKMAMSSKYLGWAVFNRNGGALIEEVDGSGRTRIIGTSGATPQVRIRPGSKFPKTVARVRREHNLLFDSYKSVHRQVRALIAMGTPFVIRSGGSSVLIDRHPDFVRDLIDKEIVRCKREAVDELARALLTIVKALVHKRAIKTGISRRTVQKAVSAEVDKDAIVGPYEQQRVLAETMRSVMPSDLYNGIKQFLDERRGESQNAEITLRTADDVERYEVD